MTDSLTPVSPSGPPAGWYDASDGSGRQRWFDGSAWTDYYQSVQPVAAPVAVQTDTRKAADRAQYVRQQKGHSLILHLTFGVFVLWIPAIYITVSPSHYWHA
jgi:hypothetical protein